MASTIKRQKKEVDEPAKVRLDELAEHISIADINIEDLLYQPKSEITATVYGHIIKFVRDKLGFQPNNIINAAADEVIRSMKDPNSDESSRRAEVSALLVTEEEDLDDEDYNRLCNLCKKIDDWNANIGGSNDDNLIKSESGVIVNPEDGSDSDGYAEVIQDSDDDIDLDQWFEKKQDDGLDIEDLAKKQTTIVPRIDLGEPVRKEGYQEYNIEPKKRPTYRAEDIIKLSELPPDVQQAFSENVKELNYIQSRIYKSALSSDDSLLICAPTGAGKTNIALLTMLRVILSYKDKDGSGYRKDKFKIIYIAPIKALVQEVVENFRNRLGRKPYNLVVEELTGDHQLDQKQISQAQLIVCTPEKWDIVTRKSLDRLYTKLVKLVIFDEIHLLHNERGATLEALVARIKRHKNMEGDAIRIIGLSATLPNYTDVAKFLHPKGTRDEFIQDSTFYFDGSHRPIPLKQQYLALSESKKVFRMINDIVYEKVMERLSRRSQSHQILIFVHSRPDTVKTAEYIKTKATEQDKVFALTPSNDSVERINEYEDLNPKLKELLKFGLGTHHAGMNKNERSCVEDLFRARHIKILVSTATLAWGVNLPARTVIIKGTQVYRDGQWTDLDSLDVTQMLGRAGRPGHDREGEGIVITEQSKVAFYVSLMTEQLPVESRLILRLAEFINAECVVGNIEDLESAVNWLSETYLNSRMKSVLMQDTFQYMTPYGIKHEMRRQDPDLVDHRRNLVRNALSLLDKRGLIVFDRTSGVVTSTELGRIAANYNCSSRTIKLFYDSIHEHTSDIELFRIFSLADEFKDIFVRRGEEADLATMLNQVPFPIDDKRATKGANKVNVLLQVYIFRLNLEGSDLICDMHFIKDNAARLARAIHELVLSKGYAYVAELSLDLCRKIDLRMTTCHSPLRQFANDLSQDTISSLEKKNYHIDELRSLDAETITGILRCRNKEDGIREGRRVYQMVKHLPKLKIEASIKPVNRNSLKVSVSIIPAFSWNKKYHGYSERFWLLIQDVNQERLLHYELVHIRENSLTEATKISFHIPYMSPVQPFYYLRLFPDRWFGCDHHLPVYIERLTLPDDEYLAAQPMDIDPVSVRELKDSKLERHYSNKFGAPDFNQIQTQSFKLLYESDEDIILLAAAGSGKTVIAELAILRNIRLYGDPKGGKGKSKVGYVAANPQAAQIIYDEWSSSAHPISRDGGVVLLTGNHRADVARVDDNSTRLVIGDVENWHILTLIRSKKYRKLFGKFQLFILDDVHQLLDDRGSKLEWLCSKLRILSKLAERPPRMVFLGSPMVCAESLKSWLAYERGTREPMLLNFAPDIRPIKLELVIQRYHHYDYSMRLLTMKRPIYRLITQMPGDKQALVFVPDAVIAEELCEILIAFHRNKPFQRASSSSSVSVDTRLKVKLNEDQREIDRIKEDEWKLMGYLDKRIGIIYQGMDWRLKSVIEDMFARKEISVLVATVGSCWSLRARSYQTIIMDTQHHSGKDAIDYPLTDLLQMIGLTGRPLVDNKCRCVIMCHFSKADYYERCLREPLSAESELPANLIDHVNYEISTGTIVELNNIYKPYLAHTYFYKRISVNPNYYGLIVPSEAEQKAKVFANFFNKLVGSIAKELRDKEFMNMEGTLDNPTFSAGLLAKISLEYYLSYRTLLNFVKWLSANPKALQLKPLELIELIATNTLEFDIIQVKHGESRELKALQGRHKLYDSDLSARSTKIKLLILSQYQKNRGREDKVYGELIEDRRYIVNLSHRLLMAIVDIAWLRDSCDLARTSIKLAQKLSPFHRSTRPKLDMNVNIAIESQTVKINVTAQREDDPFTLAEFMQDSSHLPINMYRDEGWCFLVVGRSRSKEDKLDKFALFKRVKTPIRGDNEYKLEFEPTDNDVTLYKYDLYFMSDFYQDSEDRRVTDIDLSSLMETDTEPK